MAPPAKRSSAKSKTQPKTGENLKPNDEVAQEVLSGAWGNHEERQQRLEDAGYDYDAIQRLVNKRIGAGAPAAYRSTLTEIAKQVIAGHYGDDEAECRRMLEGAGWNFAAVKAEVERLSD
jgi:hypothetical protein